MRLTALATGLLASSLAAVLLAAAPQGAGTGTAAPKAAAPSAASTYTVDDVHSSAFFRVQHLGAGQFWGRISGVSGTFTAANGAAEGVTFDITVDVNTVDTGEKKLDDHLRSPDFFNVKEFPKMTFKSNGVKGTNGKLEVTGDLTLHGVTKPISAAVEFTGAKAGPMGDRAGYEAIFTIKRSDWGVSYGVDNGMLGNDVRIVVNLEGVKK